MLPKLRVLNRPVNQYRLNLLKCKPLRKTYLTLKKKKSQL